MKCLLDLLSTHPTRVAPFTGAWVEIETVPVVLLMMNVAPFTGAWVEIGVTWMTGISWISSHPSRVRGLKCDQVGAPCVLADVAPFTGAWVEIYMRVYEKVMFYVAPFTGAWVEIWEPLSIPTRTT